MKRFRILTMAILLLHTLMAAAQQPRSLQVEQFTLKNGLTVWLNEDHSQPKVYGAVVVRAGAKDCPGTGIAHYFEHIMFKGTDRIGTTDYAAERPWLDSIATQYDRLAATSDTAQRTAIQRKINKLSLRAADYAIPNEFNRLISRFGGSALNAATGYDVTYYHNLFLPQYIEQWCWLNSERLLKPVFRLFQGELENVYEEKNRSADAMGGAMEKALRAVFRDHPYGQPVLGTTESLKNPRLSEMEAFYKKYYVAGNMGLILCGDIDPRQLQPLLEATFGRLPAVAAPTRNNAVAPPAIEPGTIDIRLPIPLVKAEALVMTAPTDYDPDGVVLDVANKLLYNGNAGLLDSLTNEHRVLAAMTGRMAFSDAGLQFMLILPKLPFGKMKKAKTACLAQMERIKQGQFSQATLDELKRATLMEAEQSLETIADRAAVMLDAFSQHQPWQAVIDQMERIKTITKDDIVRVANKYYTNQYLTLHKKYGNEPKETLKQPGYKPIQPKNAGAKSQYAKELEALPVADKPIRLVDFEGDAQRIALSPHATLYVKENTMNDIFTFTLRYLDGTRHTPLLDQLATLLATIGTDSLKKQRLEREWQRIGVTATYKAKSKTFDLSLTGRDDQLQPALALLAHFINHAKADDEAMSDLKQAAKVDHKAFGEDKESVLPAALMRVALGNASPYLQQPSAKEVKALKGKQLTDLFQELQGYDCELFYCGGIDAKQVAAMATQALPLSRCRKPQADTSRKTIGYSQPTVFFYHVPKSRQNYVVSYEQLPPAPTEEQRTEQQLWDQYMGGGMSSVLFQNVREFQSLAYSTQGLSMVPQLATHPNDSLAYATITGTQADKTLQAMHTIDSLMHAMPMKEENLEAARQEMLNDVQNSYPSFRNVAQYIADNRDMGYEQDPNGAVVRHATTLSAQQIEAYHRDHVAKNRRVWIVIGDRKHTDMKALEKYGKVVEWRKEDIYR